MLSGDELAFFAVINQTLPESNRERLAELSNRRWNETLAAGEHS